MNWGFLWLPSKFSIFTVGDVFELRSYLIGERVSPEPSEGGDVRVRPPFRGRDWLTCFGPGLLIEVSITRLAEVICAERKF